MCLIPYSLVSAVDATKHTAAWQQGQVAFGSGTRGLTWADDYRGQHRKTARWHYVDVPSDQAKDDAKWSTDDPRHGEKQVRASAPYI
jgi:hypothetical protein